MLFIIQLANHKNKKKKIFNNELHRRNIDPPPYNLASRTESEEFYVRLLIIALHTEIWTEERRATVETPQIAAHSRHI